MKLKFKIQAYQTAAVQAVVDCFKGQPPSSSDAISYRIDPGKAMGQKPLALPKRLVERHLPGAVPAPHLDPPAGLQALANQHRQKLPRPRAGQVIEQGAAHQALVSKRSRTSRSSVITPQPVAPLGAIAVSPGGSATPAMSRCTKACPCRRTAAGTAPR